jgi:thiol-disulfide isomerase/thioredoxin
MKRFILFFLLIFCVNSFSQKQIPSIDLLDFQGEKINTTDLLNNEKLTIVSLWATWCVPCIKELDAINEVYEFWKEDIDFELIAVSVDDSRSHRRALALVNGKEWPYKILLDVNQDFKRALGTSFIPQTLIIKNGKILYQHTGYQPGDENYLFEKLTEYEN